MEEGFYLSGMRIHVEVCVGSLDEALKAAALSVDSIELCAWLACGGITPSYGLVNTLTERIKLPLRVLVRPGPGGFHYTDEERQVILRDSMLIGLSGVGVVTGALETDGRISRSLIRAVRMAAPENEITFHRAIDHATDPLQGIDDLLNLQVPRVLTSGGATLADDARSVLKEMVHLAGSHLRVAVAGGVNAENVVRIVESTGAQEVHFAAQRTVAHASDKAAMSSAYAGMSFETTLDEQKVEGVLEALEKAGLR